MFYIVWGMSNSPVTRYPSVRFVAPDGRMQTVRIYDAFDQNHMYLNGGEYVYPVRLPAARYTVMAATEPTYSRRVRVYQYDDVASGVLRFDPAPGTAAQLAVSMSRTDGGPPLAIGGAVQSVPFTSIVPHPSERGPTSTAECPDLERAQKQRPVRQMVRNGQAPIDSGAAGQSYAPRGIDPMRDQLATPMGFESGVAWGGLWL